MLSSTQQLALGQAAINLTSLDLSSLTIQGSEAGLGCLLMDVYATEAFDRVKLEEGARKIITSVRSSRHALAQTFRDDLVMQFRNAVKPVVKARILEIFTRQTRLRDQHEALLNPGDSPLRDRSPLARWFVQEKRSVVAEILPQADVAVDILFELMKEPDGRNMIAAYAVDLSIWLAEQTPLVFRRIVSDYPLHRDSTEAAEAFRSRLLWVLVSRASDPRALAALDRLHMKHPEEAGRFDELRKTRFVVTEELNIAPKNGRDYLIVAAVSDLHHSPYNAPNVESVARRLQALDPDILIIAGDVANDFEYFSKALCLLRGGWAMLVLAGNHDVWSVRAEKGEGPSSEELWETVLREETEKAGAHWLEGNPVRIPSIGAAIAGTIGWYDYSGDRNWLKASPQTLAARKGGVTQDAHRIDWEFSDTDFAMTRRHWLQSVLTVLSGDSQVQRILVATHMVPFNDLIPEAETHWTSSFYKNRAPYYYTPTLGAMIARFPKVQWSVSGHNHLGNQVDIERPGMTPIDARIIAEDDPALPENEIVVYKFSVAL